MIISEPMGYMLLNERMLETYLHAKKWLKPTGKMFPSRGDLHVAPFTDEALYMEQVNKVNFWYQDYFHGVNLSSLRDDAMKEYFRQPIVDTFDIRICLAKTERHVIDFYKTNETELHCIDIPLEFHILQSGIVHGLAFWFDVAFIGTGATVWLSTSPTEPLTHWYQVRCLLEQPIFVKEGQMLSGRVIMQANMKQSYDVTIECQVVGTSTNSKNSLDLKNPYFRYTGVQPQPPPGENHVSPSEMYWSQVDVQGARQAVNLVNGMIVDGLGHVSLDNGPGISSVGNSNGLGGQPNIHQGSILATGRSSKDVGHAAAVAANGITSAAAAGLSTPMSAANSLQFNQLIGGGVSPNLLGASCHTTMSMASATSQQGLNLTTSASSSSSNHFNIGDYMHVGSGSLGSNAGASTAAGAPPATAFKH
jgi:histone-arginine methyltransferase CARM1